MVGPRGLLVDVRPLSESRPFRAWWLGSSLSVFGSQLTAFGLIYYVWSTTHRADLVGGVALAQVISTVLGAMIGGALADRGDRRRLVIVTRLGQLLGSIMLAVVVTAGFASIPLLYLVVAVESAFGAAGAPANRSFTARLLPAPRLTAGLALSRLADQVSLLGGPIVAGAVIALWSVQACFVVDAVTSSH
jgi:MFS family permease